MLKHWIIFQTLFLIFIVIANLPNSVELFMNGRLEDISFFISLILVSANFGFLIAKFACLLKKGCQPTRIFWGVAVVISSLAYWLFLSVLERVFMIT